jgi:hypothetical protein
MSEWREDLDAIKTFGLGKVLYWRFVYRHHMRFIHKRGGHAMRHYGPLMPDGGGFDKCDWCGHIENVVPCRTALFDHLSTPQPNVDEGDGK